MLRIKNIEKQQIVAVLIMVLLTSLFISRVVLSISTILFCSFGIVAYYKELFSFKTLAHKQFLFFTTIFFLALYSGVYSNNEQEWLQRTIVKIPLLLLPIVFMCIRLSDTTVFVIPHLWVLLVTGGTVYTASMYYLYTDDLLQGYQQARVLPTLLDGDHIRFSWCVAIALIFTLKQHSQIGRKSLKIINSCIGIWLFIFLHILMSKTGLILAYMAICIYTVAKIIALKNKHFLWVLPILAIMPWVSYTIFPTFKKRVDYMLYDYNHYSNGMYKEGLSDGARLVSIHAGISIIKEHPLIGVGYGDVETSAKSYYNTKHNLQEYEKILPSSQYLMVGAACGILGLLLFLAALFIPIFNRYNWKNSYFLMFYIPALCSFLFEIHLESQYGVFIFAFFTLWFAKFCKPTHT
jgi:O-antigen ligase